jgi:predicted transcriptional regulator
MTDKIPDASTHDAKPGSMLALTTKIVAAYVRHNATQAAELPALIDQVFQSLAGLATSSGATAETLPVPAVSVKKSVFPDHIVCFEDGKKLRMLKRHLMASYGMTPEAYRERWACRRTTRWWRPATPPGAPPWPKRSASVASRRRPKPPSSPDHEANSGRCCCSPSPHFRVQSGTPVVTA